MTGIVQRPFLPYSRQHIDDDDIRAVTEALKSEYLTTGPRVAAFEKAFADFVGCRHAVAVASGTAALHLALRTLDVGPGDACIVPTITFLATANAVRFCQADVAFADVDPETGLATAETLARAASRADRRRIRAFIPVHIGGQTASLREIAAVAAENDAVVIEDACHALGTRTTDNGLASMTGDCRFSAMAAFSFHPVKTITCGEGGMITTNDPVAARRISRERNHGMTREFADFQNRELALDADGLPNPWFYEMTQVGFNYRLSDIQCALGLSQLAKFHWLAERRRRLAKIYDQCLKPLDPIVRPVAKVSGSDPVLHLYVVLIDFERVDITRAQLMQVLRAEGIGTQVHYLPVHRQSYYQQLYGRRLLPGAEAYYAKCLSIPLFPDMNDKDPERVIDAIANCLGLA